MGWLWKEMRQTIWRKKKVSEKVVIKAMEVHV